jgi:NADH-quinone oxidoreductase subunit M
MSVVPSITALTFTPLFGGGLILLVAAVRARRRSGVPARRGADQPANGAAESQSERWVRWVGQGFGLLALGEVVLLWWGFDRGAAGFQWVERHPWVPVLGVEYSVGLDGLGLVMAALTALVVPMAMWRSGAIGEQVPLYFALVLFLQAGLFGTFTALNFFHWFMFWELSLVPAFFLVRLWGGPGRGPVATQFFVYTMVGSVALLLAFLALYLAAGTFDFGALAALGRENRWAALLSHRLGWPGVSGETLAGLVCLGVFFGFAVKVPVMPFHTWLPATYATAPVGTTMLLTGAMSKMGVYGLLRLLVPVFPHQMRAWWGLLMGLAVLSVVGAAAAALAQRDLRRMLAYSSINHLGYCLLGVVAALRATGESGRLATERAAALDGVVLQMFNHGLTAATLFAFLGLLEDRTGGRRGLDDFGGLRRVAPVFCGLMGTALFASLGLPGLGGFVGEFLIFKGAFPLAPWATALSAAGLLLTAVFLLTLVQRVFHGPLNPRLTGFADLTVAERSALLPALGLMFVVGIWPQSLLAVINPAVTAWVALFP